MDILITCRTQPTVPVPNPQPIAYSCYSPPIQTLHTFAVRVVMLVPSWFPRPHVSFETVLPRLDGDAVSVVIVVRGTMKDLVGNTIANLQVGVESSWWLRATGVPGGYVEFGPIYTFNTLFHRQGGVTLRVEFVCLTQALRFVYFEGSAEILSYQVFMHSLPCTPTPSCCSTSW